MRGKQVAAFVAAVILIAGAWLVRTQVIDGEGGSTSTSQTTAATVVCVTELQDACRQALAGRTDVDLNIESVNVTLDRRGSEATPSDAIWITMQPFPEMVERLRASNRVAPSETTTEPVASSPLTLVVAAARAESLQIGCGVAVDWRCLGNAAGSPWTALDPSGSGDDVRPAFAPHPDTAIGQLGVANAVLGFFGGSAIDPADTGFITWSRSLARATNPNIVAGSTAIAVIQTRLSAFDVAVGAAAELANSDDSRFVTIPASPAASVDIVAVVPADSSMPSGLSTDLQQAFTAGGWGAPRSAASSISADDMLLIRTLWEELTS